MGLTIQEAEEKIAKLEAELDHIKGVEFSRRCGIIADNWRMNVAEIIELLHVQTIWVKASLNCADHVWDWDQVEAATQTCNDSERLIAKYKRNTIAPID